MREAATAFAAFALGALAASPLGACRVRQTAAVEDAGAPPDPAAIKRGEYLVKAVAGCGECHTPRLPNGKLDPALWLAGAADRFDVEPGDDQHGRISAPNLTPSRSGLLDWTDSEVKRAIVEGWNDTHQPLHPVMPYYVFHNMTDADVDAIVQYLRSVPPIEHTIPPRQALSVPLTQPAQPVPDAAIPHTTLKPKDPSFKHAENGRYLAASVGLCMDCHTAWRPDAEQPLALERLFAGRRGFSQAEWSLVGTPPIVFSYNITPHPSGIKGWTPENVRALLKTGVDDQGIFVCPPMPSGPNGAHGALTDEDALDIGWYLTTLPPIDSGDIPACPAR